VARFGANVAFEGTAGAVVIFTKLLLMIFLKTSNV
jgi:hypothetical protein